MQIAVYGKGGIGKSTVSANLSAALAAQGKTVLQIGCDPKHDSTRLLHHGQKIRTVLDYLLNTPADAQRVEDVLVKGFGGACCVEAGGPRPGMGCAGRGILTSFDFLERHAVLQRFDTVLYDVLGDVVCGGFAVPVRSRYADAVFLVTSGEAMALYAANNILQGIRNLNPNERRIAGIIYNSRGLGDDRLRLEEFARAVRLPVVLAIPRSEAFARAELTAQTVVEAQPEGEEATLFLSLAQRIADGLPLFEAQPLGEEQMERLLRGLSLETVTVPEPTSISRTEIPAVAEKAAQPPAAPPIPQKRALSDPFSRVPLFGCAYRGAVDLAVHIKDAAVLGHAPKSCTWYAVNGITGYSRRGLFDRGVLYPAFIPRNFENTDITVQDAVFGGVEHAREKAIALAKRGARMIIAVTACIPGLSGDDLTPVKQELKALGCDMYIVRTDGVSAGDYNEGMALCYKTLAREAVQPCPEQDPDSINLVYEQTWSARTDGNFVRLRGILDALRIRVNCRFLCATGVEEIRGFLRAPWNILARDDALGLELREIFEKEHGCRFLDGGLPRGFAETERWVRTLSGLYGREPEAEALIARSRAEYGERLRALRPIFRGKRMLLFLSGDGCNWLPELLEDLGVDVVKAMLFGKKRDGNSGWNRRFSADWASDRSELRAAVDALRPELAILSDPSALPDPPPWLTVLPAFRDLSVGFYAGTDVAQRWAGLMENALEGRWKRDKSLFEKYYC